ncbi:MAG: hypothetical protein KDA60_16270 [Planctomycetales bacterium]|nr:hypothetical protein [Planctomycetales bacterium]
MPTANDTIREKASLVRGVLLSSCEKVGGDFEPWNQYLMVKGKYSSDEFVGRGLCHGLSIIFLKCAKNGRVFSNQIDQDVMEVGDRYARTTEQTEIQNAHYSQINDDTSFMEQNYGFTHVETKKFGDLTPLFSHTRCGNYVGESNFFHLVSTGGHCMAVASNAGTTFFEPNAGIVTCDGGKMSDLFSEYFGHPLIKEVYGHDSKVQLAVTRFTG